MFLTIKRLGGEMMISPKKRANAIAKADKYYNALLEDIENEKLNLIRENLASVGIESELSNIDSNLVLKYTPISYGNMLYNNVNFKDYVKYAFVAKRCQRAINKIRNIFLIIILLIGVLIFLISKNIIISVIISIVLLIIFAIVFSKKFKGETYDSFYKRTMYPLIYNVLDNFKYSKVDKNNFSLPVKGLLNKTYTDQQISNKILFNSDFCNGEIYDLKLIKKDTKTVDGKTTTTTSEVFDGFSVSIVYNNSIDRLKGAIIEIREDDNLFSAIAEDTVNSMFESNRNYNFNTEELNKALDCTISGTNNFEDIDGLMMEVNKIITPLFEEYLTYLKKRYNSFNMTITDKCINFNVSLDKTTYQKIKGGELFNFDSKYSDATRKVSMPIPNVSSAKDFFYYNIFPEMEHLFLMKYFNEIFKSSIDDKGVLTGNVEIIKNYQNEMLEISNMLFKDFKSTHKDEIASLYEESLTIYKNE